MESTDEYSPQQSPNLQSPEYTLSFPNDSLNFDTSHSAKTLFDILKNSPHNIETALTSTGIILTLDIVNQVLKLCHNDPHLGIDFFRFAGRLVKFSLVSWNLMVDLLGNNGLFDEMWDAIRSMKRENVLGINTFCSVFSSYCKVGKISEAIMSFDVMHQYGVEQDVVAFNSVLRAICNVDGKIVEAVEFFDRNKSDIAPDGETYAILIEGWGKEGNVAKAKSIFGEMVVRVGWNSKYMAVYDSFLILLIRDSQTDSAFTYLRVMKERGCFLGLAFFSNAIDMLIKRNDCANAIQMWDIMVHGGLMPNLIMYNSMIGLLCNNNDIVNMFKLFDDMVFHGAFPDFLTYKMIFRCLVKNKKVSQAGSFFREMIKNENPPTHFDCAAAITMFISSDDPEMAIEVWNYMVGNQELSLDDSANALLVGLCNLGRLVEVKRFAEDMLDRRINIHESTMEKLKTAFYKGGITSSMDKFDSLSRKWKSS